MARLPYLDPEQAEPHVAAVLSKAPAPQQLVGFARVPLPAGQSKTATVTFSIWQLAVTPGDIEGSGPRQIQPGDYQVQVGSASAPFSIH